ncbi:MAG: hypothetical protein AAB653_01055 [Patescibacteria group bacterium]
MNYYKDLVTKKSFGVLQQLKHKCQFILIGGWAVFLYTHSLKSKDIDVVIEHSELEKLRKSADLVKNDRLKKYEIVIGEVDIDIYVPFYSNPGLPAEEIKKYTQQLEGFLLPRPEILLILKQRAYLERLGTPKAEKDKIDIISLLKNVELDFDFYKEILKRYNLKNYLSDLKNLLQTTTQVPELGLNQFQYSRLKKKVLGWK